MEDTTVNTEEVLEDVVSEELDGGGLPSAQEDKQLDAERFAITDEIKEKYFKNGKLQGRFDDIEGLILANKSIEDKYSALMREIKAGKYQEVTPTEVDTTAQVAELTQPLVQEYVANGMELTDELLAKAKEQGLDIRDVKLAAIEIKEKITSAYNIVGGKTEYEAMITWGKENLDDKAKVAFDKELASGMGEFAIKGLYAEYKASGKAGQQPQRIMGDNSSATGVKAYQSMDEILKDKAYLNSPRGRVDAGAKALYDRRMKVTSDDVVFGRR